MVAPVQDRGQKEGVSYIIEVIHMFLCYGMFIIVYIGMLLIIASMLFCSHYYCFIVESKTNE